MESNSRQFVQAANAFLADPTHATLIKLQSEAADFLEVSETDPSEKEWIDWREVENDFEEIRVILRGHWGAGVAEVKDCLNYALRETLCGEDIYTPRDSYNEVDNETILTYGYDSTKSRRDDPDFKNAFGIAFAYILHGTPVRKTDRAGAGTKGTRRYAGIGVSPNKIEVR